MFCASRYAQLESGREMQPDASLILGIRFFSVFVVNLINRMLEVLETRYVEPEKRSSDGETEKREGGEEGKGIAAGTQSIKVPHTNTKNRQ